MQTRGTTHSPSTGLALAYPWPAGYSTVGEGGREGEGEGGGERREGKGREKERARERERKRDRETVSVREKLISNAILTSINVRYPQRK